MKPVSFFGSINLKEPSGISKAFELKTKIKPYRKGQIAVYLFGNIIQLDSDEFSLTNEQVPLIYRMYRRYGEDFIRYLDGYFLIILIDRDSAYFFNNPYSNTSLYYYFDGERFIFSDQLKTILPKLEKRPQVNMDIVNLFLNSGYSYSNKTMFKDIYRMVPAHYLRISRGKINIKRYYSMRFKRKKVKDISKLQSEYERLWQEAISNFIQFNGVKSVGSALSGGVDTSWVVWNASRVYNKPIHTYTADYKFSLFNESDKAEYVTKVCKGIHHKIDVGESDLDLLPEMIHAAEEPVLASSLSLYKIMKQADVDIFLTGDGGNNIFNHLYPVCEIHRYIRHLPYFLRRVLYLLTDSIARTTGWERLFELKYPLHAFSYRNFYDNFYLNLTCYRHFSAEDRKKLFKPDFYDNFKEKGMVGELKIGPKTFCNDLIAERFIYGSMQYVSTFHDKFAKSFGMLLFPPYQNKKIIDFICSLPFDQLNKGNTFQRLTNRALRMPFQKKILARYFGKKHAYQCGQPFDQPFDDWFSRRPLVIIRLFERLKKRGWYDGKYLDQLYREHKKQHQHKKIYCRLKNHGYRIMALLSLEVWCMEFIDGKDKRPDMPLEESLA